MKRKTLRRLQKTGLIICVLLIALIGYQAWNIWQGMQKANQLPVLGSAPEFTMENLKGEDMSFSETDGKVRLVYFFFATCDDVCPLNTKQMARIQEKLEEEGLFGKEVELIGITIDPDNDTLNVLKVYKDQFHLDPEGWTFLRPKNKEIAKDVIWKFGGMMVGENHSGSLFLVDQDGKVRKNYTEQEDEVIMDGIMQLVKA